MTINGRTSLAGLIAAIAVLAAASYANAATNTVSSLSDTGGGTLRGAIGFSVPGDVVNFSVAGTITLTAGEILIDKNLSILGPGASVLAVNGNAASRVFNVTNAIVVISGLTVTNGVANGATFPHNSGGGIYNDHSTLTVSNCTLNGNSASYGGGILNDGYGISSATLAIVNSTLSGNSAILGGGIYNDGANGSAMLTVIASTIKSNPAEAGGGIYNDGANGGSATLTISASTLSGNSASDGGGGGIYNDGGNGGEGVATLVNSTLSGNSALGYGGGIRNLSFLTLNNCTVSSNTASVKGFGGGIYSSFSLTLNNCTVSDNTCDGFGSMGGGIYGENSTLTVNNCTVFHNLAFYGGGIALTNEAGLTVDSSTIASNGAGGIYNVSSTVDIRNTIIAKNFGEGLFDASGAFTSFGYNLIRETDGSSGWVGSDLTGTLASPLNPMLGPLADNGGLTKTMALLVGSPAIDKGKGFGLGPDQRGQPRYDNPNIANASGGAGADIGAYEATDLRIVNAQKTGNHLRLDFLNWLGTNYEVQSRSDLKTGSWGSLLGTTPGDGGIASTTVSNAFSVPKQFYRIHPVP